MNQLHSTTLKRFIILGNPGIGKTMFGLYVMWRIVLEGNRYFMYEFAKDKIKLFTPGFVIDLDRYKALNLCSFFPDQIIYLVDLQCDREEPDGEMLSFFTMVFSSPNPTRYHSFAKSDYAMTYYMKIPTEEVVKDMWRSLSRFKNIPEADIDNQILIYGCIPRFVLLTPRHGEDFLKKAIERKGSLIYNMLVNGIAAIEGKDEELSYILVHLDSTDFCHSIYRAGSPFILEKLLKEQKTSLVNGFLSYVKDPKHSS